MLTRSSKLEGDRDLLHQAGLVAQKSDYLGTQIWAIGILTKSGLVGASEAINSTLNAWAYKMENVERLSRYSEYNTFSHAFYIINDPRGDHVYASKATYPNVKFDFIEKDWVKYSRSDSGQLWVEFQNTVKDSASMRRLVNELFLPATEEQKRNRFPWGESLTFDDNVKYAISLAKI